ncbi:ATP-binding protein [Fundidesulfovibrio terrae]|uniref:ATP-binding protein n=1 Tax=Fundidesulfovibrio terrae TaxID=2922866 RepID=UPI001FAFDE44|nr:ATP-binding protein [Fundidesulfovibrio terrae]
MPKTRTLTMTIDSSLDNVSLVGNAVRGILENEPGPRHDIPLVELAVCEAVNNAIIHGYDQKEGFPVEVSLSLAKGKLIVTVADRGRGFSTFPDALPKVPAGEDLQNMPLGGWGLRIMGEVMEQVRYSSDAGRNELTMSRAWA